MAVSDALLRNEPYLITRCVTDIAKAYNRYYYEQRILTDDCSASFARLLLSRATKEVIQTGLNLLGIETPEKM
jgi:arginyl-tRNA synthetase